MPIVTRYGVSAARLLFGPGYRAIADLSPKDDLDPAIDGSSEKEKKRAAVTEAT